MPADYGSSPDSYLSDSKGWLTTLDHKRVGVLYLASVAVALLLGALSALVLRIEAMSPGKTLMDAESYRHAITTHGTVAVFLFLIPAVFAGIGNVVLPMQVGAKGVAYPRLNLIALYLFWIGALVTVATTMMGAGGSTLTTPTASAQAIPSLAGLLVMALSAALTGVNFMATIHKMRAPGLGWGRLSLFSWSLYATSAVQIAALFALAAAVVLLATRPEMFDSRTGGSSILFEQLFWFYAHPAMYAMIVPAMGIASEIVATFARRQIVGYWSLAVSSIATAGLGFLAWGQHLFASGISDVSTLTFSAAAILVTVPAGLAIANWLATLGGGSISLESPMLWALAFILQFTIGSAAGLFVGAMATGIALHDTSFSVAQFHYLVVGGTATAFLGGLHYWWPKVTGRRYSESLARLGFGLVFLGMNLAFLPQFAVGAAGVAQAQLDYASDVQPMQAASMGGAALLVAGLFLLAYMFLSSLRGGQRSSRNPWGSVALEWQSPSPAPVANFVGAPRLTVAPYDYHLATAEDLEQA